MFKNIVLWKGHDYGHDDHHGGYGGHDDHHGGYDHDHHGGYDEHPVGGYKDHGGHGHGHHRRVDSLAGGAPNIPVYYGNHYDNARQDSKMYSSLNSIFPEEKETSYKDPFYSGYKGDRY